MCTVVRVRRLCVLLIAAAVLASLTGCGSSGAHTTTRGRADGRATTTGRTPRFTLAGTGAFGTAGTYAMACFVQFRNVACGVNRPPRPYRKYLRVDLNASGKVYTCRGLRCISNLGPLAFTLPVGKSARVGRFSCTALTAGVGCFCKQSSHGFLLKGSGPARSATYAVTHVGTGLRRCPWPRG
jgi:hypothetical protein